MKLALFLFSFASLLLISGGSNDTCNQLKDFNVFTKVLLSKEGRIDLHTSEDVIRNQIEKVRTDFSVKLSLLEQFKRYSTILSKVECGHTQIHPNKEVLREWLSARKSLPIDFYLIGRRLVVNQLLSTDEPVIHENKSLRERKKSVPTGAEILLIDHKTVDEMVHDMSRYLSSDENTIDFKYFQASQMFDFYRHVARSFTKDSIAVSYVYNKDTAEIYLATGAAPVNTMNLRLKNSMIRFNNAGFNMGEFNIKNDIGYFRFKSFKSSYGSKYEAFLRRSFEKLKTKKIDKLIIDLRGNTGGAMQYQFVRYFVGEGVELGRYVVEKPKHGFENMHIKKFNAEYFKYKRVSKTQRRLKRRDEFNDGKVFTDKVDTSLIYTGQLVVITDEGTFSSASILACHMKTLANAKLVGRTAGGSFYAGNAGTLILQLPKSKMHVFINPNTFYSQLEQSNQPTLIKQPDTLLSPFIINEKDRDQFYYMAAKSQFE